MVVTDAVRVAETGLRSATTTPSLMLTAADVAALLACSTKTVYRLADRGALPRPVRLGGLLRWRRGEIDQWIDEGCPTRSRR